MDREHERDNRPESKPADGPIADRLDRLSSAEAEQVILRALELTDADVERDSYGMLDIETLEVVARELNIPLRHLRAAMAEQRTRTATEGDDSWFDRLLKIDQLDGATLVKGNVDAVHRALVTWFTSHEGLRAVHVVANRGEWEKDSTPLTSLRMGLGMTNSSRALRGAGTIHHEIKSIGIEEHIVTIEAGKELVRMTGKGLLAGAATLSVLAAVSVAAGPASLGAGLLTGLLTALVFTTGAIAGVRAWAGRINRSIRRALGAITDPASSGVFDALPGSVGRFLRGLGLGRRR